jgi:putative transposase
VTPAARRQAVAIAQEEHGLSRRRACRLVGISRSARSGNPSARVSTPGFVSACAPSPASGRRFGYRRLHELLRREGFAANHKLVERLYREEKLAIRRRGRQKRGLGCMAGSWCPIAANQRWSLDFTEDCLANGRRFRTANLKDDLHARVPGHRRRTSRCRGQRVVDLLEGVARERGYPDVLVVDNGPSCAAESWTGGPRPCVRLFFIDPASRCGTPRSRASTAASARSASTRAGSPA